MYIEEPGVLISKGDSREQDGSSAVVSTCGSDLAVWDAKRALVGAGARALLNPTLLYNVIRSRFQSEFRWWDWIDEELGVSGVVTLIEPYETLIPSSLYHVSIKIELLASNGYASDETYEEAHGIKHLVIPTTDYIFAPTIGDICRAVDFIHENTFHGDITYVHCKAGRGRSTTIVLCYLVQYRHMTPESAYEYIRSIQPRVLLASAQWQAVNEFYRSNLERNEKHSSMIVKKTTSGNLSKRDMSAFDDGFVVVVTESDLAGYEADDKSRYGSCAGAARNDDVLLPELSLACKV